MKFLLVIVIVVAILASMAILAAIVLASPFIHEDSFLWNCYLMALSVAKGHQCGNADQVVGFILGGED